jgi:hypothetical protein|tara:strand:- start:70 stop:651 length:582 start_codon:yes stop_codon:yes gene_type:complete
VNKINWKLAPESAIGVAQRGQQLAFVDNDRNIFLDGHWGISMGWELVAKRPTFAESITKTPQLEQTKTVADAVEKPRFKATRENLEKIAKDAKGDFVEVGEPEWTHEIRATKEYCYISEGPNDSGQVFIKTNKGIWDCLYVEQLKPIKPTITKSDLADFVIEKLNDGTHQDAVCYLLQQKLDQHEVIEGPAND